MATDEQDSTARPGGPDPHPGGPGHGQSGANPHPGGPGHGQSDAVGAPTAGGTRAQDDADEGTFRWPSTGIPRFFGQHTAEVGEADLGAAAWASAYAAGTAAPPGDVPQPGPARADVPAPENAPHEAPLSAEAAGAPAVGYRHGTPAWLYTETAGSLTTDFLLPGRTVPPESGWRRLLHQATGGRLTPPPSAAQRRRRDLVARVRTPVAGGHHRVAVLSLKGGVGKTTTVVGLGSTLASLRGDRVIALDANPDRGTLSDKFRLETAATVRDLLNERDQIQRYADVRAYTTQAESRLELLASDRDPAISVAFSGEDYGAVAQVLERYYSICLTDCGTGLLHSALAGALRLADQIVLVSTPSVDGARSASATLDWLQVHGYGDLVRGGVVVLSMVRRRSGSKVDIGRLEQHFAARCRAVVRVPYDPHLEEGAEVEMAQLDSATVDAYLTLAAEVGDGFARPRGTARPSRHIR